MFCERCAPLTRTLTFDPAAEPVAYFRELEEQFPNWPLFRPERRAPEVAERVRRMVHRNTRRACIDLERMDREYRKRQSEGQAPEAEPGAAADRGGIG